MLEILLLRCYCFVAVLFSNTLSNINFNVKILTEDTEVNKQKLSYNVKIKKSELSSAYYGETTDQAGIDCKRPPYDVAAPRRLCGWRWTSVCERVSERHSHSVWRHFWRTRKFGFPQKNQTKSERNTSALIKQVIRCISRTTFMLIMNFKVHFWSRKVVVS